MELLKMVIQDKKLPWFKFYANDFIVKTVGLTNEQVGIYIKLLAYTWAYGPQPNDMKVINSIVQGGEATELVLARFFETDDQGKLYEPSLDVLRIESLESAEINRKRTAAATAAVKVKAAAKAAKSKAKRTVTEPSRNRRIDVTTTEVEVRGKDESYTQESKPQENGKQDVQAINRTNVASTLPKEHSGTLDKKSSVVEIPREAFRQKSEPVGAAPSRPAPDYSSAQLCTSDLYATGPNDRVFEAA